MRPSRSARTWAARGGGDAAREVGRGRGDGAAESGEERAGERVGRYADRDGGEAGGRKIGEAAVKAAAQHEGERAGPERRGQKLCGLRQAGERLRPGEVGHVDDQWIESRPSLGDEYLGGGARIAGIGAEAVDRLGREGDQFARMQEMGGGAQAARAVREGDGVVLGHGGRLRLSWRSRCDDAASRLSCCGAGTRVHPVGKAFPYSRNGGKPEAAIAPGRLRSGGRPT